MIKQTDAGSQKSSIGVIHISRLPNESIWQRLSEVGLTYESCLTEIISLWKHMASLFYAQGQKTMHNRSNMIFDNHSNGSVHLANIIMLLCISTNRPHDGRYKHSSPI